MIQVRCNGDILVIHHAASAAVAGVVLTGGYSNRPMHAGDILLLHSCSTTIATAAPRQGTYCASHKLSAGSNWVLQEPVPVSQIVLQESLLQSSLTLL